MTALHHLRPRPNPPKKTSQSLHELFPQAPPPFIIFFSPKKMFSGLAVKASPARLSRDVALEIPALWKVPCARTIPTMGMVAAFNELRPIQFCLADAGIEWQSSHGLVASRFAYRANFWHLGSPFASPTWPVTPVSGSAISCSFPPSQIWPVTF